jgi:DNA-binding MarR family transcriptional regulator
LGKFSERAEPDEAADAAIELPYSVNDPEHRLALALRELRRAWPAWYAFSYGSVSDLDPGQYDVLWHLAVGVPVGCRMGELAAALRIDSSTATRAVDRLVKQGLVRRVQSSEDRRVFLAQATSAGRRLVSQMSSEATQRWRPILHKALTVGEMTVLTEWLQRLTTAYDEALDIESLDSGPGQSRGAGPGSSSSRRRGES